MEIQGQSLFLVTPNLYSERKWEMLVWRIEETRIQDPVQLTGV